MEGKSKVKVSPTSGGRSVGIIRFRTKGHGVKSLSYPRKRPWRPKCCKMLRIPNFLESRLTDGGKVVSLTRRPLIYSPETYLCFRYSLLIKPQSLVRPEGLGKVVEGVHLIGQMGNIYFIPIIITIRTTSVV
jgi:hypothetical protein